MYKVCERDTVIYNFLETKLSTITSPAVSWVPAVYWGRCFLGVEPYPQYIFTETTAANDEATRRRRSVLRDAHGATISVGTRRRLGLCERTLGVLKQVIASEKAAESKKL